MTEEDNILGSKKTKEKGVARAVNSVRRKHILRLCHPSLCQ